MKKSYLFVLMTALIMSVIASSCMAAEISLAKALENGQATKTLITPLIDGQPLKVDYYVAPYVANPNRPEDQRINIYVPETATPKSPVLFVINNGGWFMDDYFRTLDDSAGIAIRDGVNYQTDINTNADTAKGREQFSAMALKRGFVVVSYGARGRNNGATDGLYLGHSPATATDTKAAIRYLRANREFLKNIDTGKIIANGTSGGGAMTSLICASGNNSDFFPYLYEIGAAGITRNPDGTFTSDPAIGDNVFAGMAYCPITDLGNADAAYEFLYNSTRAKLFEDGKLAYDVASNDDVMRRSDALKARYASYVDSLGLKRKDGTPLTSENLEGEIIKLMRTEIEESINEIGIEKMRADIEGSDWHANNWLTLNDDGTYTYDFEAHKYFVAMNTKLKIAPAFSNSGLYEPQQQNEDNLFGTREEPYSPFEFLSWNEDTVKNTVGKDNTGLDWDDYMKTDAGKALAQQIKMTCPFDYLSHDKSDVAPYWYVRWGMKDRDSSFALETVFYHELLNCKDIKNLNFEFAWLFPHSGNYDGNEAFAWLDSVLAPSTTFNTSAQGKNGDVNVSVSIEDGKITSVVVGDHKEDTAVYEPSKQAVETIPAAIIANQSITVDAVTGATLTSTAIMSATEKALTLAGLNPEDFRKSVTKAGEGVVSEESAKVVVVGGGAAGMTAALKLAQNGVDVLVIEKGPTIGVANGWNCGGPMASNTSVQKAEGVSITDEMLFNDLTDDAYLTSDSRLLRRVIARTGEAVELQLNAGLSMFLRPDNYGAGYRSRHGYNGQKSERAPIITEAYAKAGGRLMCETAGESLIVENGDVTGITAKKSDGSTLNIKADAVLLATGGYLGNNKMIREHWGDIDVNPLGNTLSTGDGINMAKAAGGFDEESSYAMISNEFGGSNKKGGGWQRPNGAMTIGIYGGMLVDPNGERFFNEYYMANQPLSVGGEAVLRAGKFYAVIDQAFVDAISTVGLFEYLGNPSDWYVGTMTAKGVVLKTLPEDLKKAIAQGWAVKADTIEECAKFFGMDKLADTVKTYNAYCEAGKDEDYFKSPTFLKPIVKAPFYVVEYEPSAWGTLGGVRTDSSLRVLRKDLKPIKGLYAAGVDAGSLYCQPYYQVEGAAVGLAFGSGIYAADVIMNDLVK